MAVAAEAASANFAIEEASPGSKAAAAALTADASSDAPRPTSGTRAALRTDATSGASAAPCADALIPDPTKINATNPAVGAKPLGHTLIAIVIPPQFKRPVTPEYHFRHAH